MVSDDKTSISVTCPLSYTTTRSVSVCRRVLCVYFPQTLPTGNWKMRPSRNRVLAARCAPD